MHPATLWLVIKPQGKLDGSRLIALSIHVPETPRAEVRVRIAEVRPVKDVAELSFEPHFQPLLHREDFEYAQVLVVSGESTNRSVAPGCIAELQEARVRPGARD